MNTASMPIDSDNKKLFIAFPDYLNTLPLLHFLRSVETFFIIKDTPKRINEALKAGLLDVGLASSLFYAKHHQELLILPDISISATGKVKSVILYHHKPLERLSNKRIGITPETETSFGLLRLVLEEFIGITPKYEFLESRFSDLQEEKILELSGYLAIGDEALILENNQIFEFSTDLAELWLMKTGLPFVFALLVVRREIAELKRTLIEKFLMELFFSRAKGLSSLAEIVKVSTHPLNKGLILNYLQHLEYDFSGLKQRAFQCFCEFLYKKSIIQQIPSLNFFPL